MLWARSLPNSQETGGSRVQRQEEGSPAGWKLLIGCDVFISAPYGMSDFEELRKEEKFLSLNSPCESSPVEHFLMKHMNMVKSQLTFLQEFKVGNRIKCPLPD